MRAITFASLLTLLIVFHTRGQGQRIVTYHDAGASALTGKIVPTPLHYHRFDTSLFPLSPGIKTLLTQSAGLAVHFFSNSSSITARWKVSGNRPLSNMTPIGQKGLDLYIKKDGKWQFAGVGRPGSDSGSANFIIVQNMSPVDREFLLYLPLYDGTRELEIGVDSAASYKAAPDPFRKRILIYGTSIVQGASASRPGMTYPALLSRATGLNFLNLGLSGSAKMERAAADMVASVDADAYLIDCMPNCSPAQVTERTADFVTAIRRRHPAAPIVFVESIVREHGFFDTTVGATVRDKNKNLLVEINKLRKSGVKDLYFIGAGKMIGGDHEGTTDGTHPNDLGFYRMAEDLKVSLLPILKKYGIY